MLPQCQLKINQADQTLECILKNKYDGITEKLIKQSRSTHI